MLILFTISQYSAGNTAHLLQCSLLHSLHAIPGLFSPCRFSARSHKWHLLRVIFVSVEAAGASVEAVGASVDVAGASVEAAGASVEAAGVSVEAAEASVEAAEASVEAARADVGAFLTRAIKSHE